MARPIGPEWDDTEWEVCEDRGFVYKKRRRRHLASLAGHPPVDSEAQLQLKKHALKKRCLLTIRDKYRSEIEQWEELSASLIRLASPPAKDTSEAGTSSIASPRPSYMSPPAVDVLFLELEAQEAIFRKLSDLCDSVDLFCEAQEDRLTQSLLDLPIWGSPRALMRSLCN
ncbi:uncharacterized protein LOC110032335 [Phalaenopsis equestris]|uniref:uncharacterized protein LOC110032335 n=1 Tax=Phalaenopsis equestris TaxID=78828 RepID=UPI0009E2544A|nr:uncharacterized protein LOC110032335 [Phalaenopsis equestris]